MKKIISILILFILIILLFINNVNAITFNDKDGNVIILTDVEHLEYVFYYWDSSVSWYRMYSFNSLPVCHSYNSDTGEYYCSIYDSTGTGKDEYQYCQFNSSGSIVMSNSIVTFNGSIAKTVNISDILYSNFDFIDTEGNVVFADNSNSVDDKFELQLSVEPEEQTINVPVLITSQLFTEEGINKYNLEYSLDTENWKDTGIRSITSISENTTYYQFYYNTYKNETIYFRLENLETGEYIYDTVVIDNIIYNQDNINNYIDGKFKPTPFLSIEYVSDTEIIISTQKFYIDELEKIECSYLKDEGDSDLDNEDLWTNLNIRSFTDSLSGETTYQFYTSIYNNDGLGDGTYYFRFLNKETGDETFATAEIIFQNIIDYNKEKTKIDETLDKLINFFKERFGFLVYPFELIIDVLERINTVQFETPKFSVPDVYEPTTNEKLISAFEFNFNDLLTNDILKTIHEIYLILVDAFIIFSLVNLARKKIMGVLEK